MKKIVFLSIIALAIQAWSWADLGHSAIGYIAQKNLTPKAQLMVQHIVGVEPLAISGTWPDHARSDERFKNFANYHFLDQSGGRADQDAKTIIEDGVKRILDKKATREEKMIWYRFLIHVVGDIHQPLHIGNGIDRGGNMCEVKWNGSITNLHTFWDDKLVGVIETEYNLKNPPPPGKKRWFGYVELTDILLNEFPDMSMQSENKLKTTEWYADSQSLHSVVYPDSTPAAERTYCKSSPTRSPTLDDAYVKKTLPVAKKQIIKAGFRLAQLLNDMSLKYKIPSKYKLLDTEKILIKNQKK